MSSLVVDFDSLFLKPLEGTAAESQQRQYSRGVGDPAGRVYKLGIRVLASRLNPRACENLPEGDSQNFAWLAKMQTRFVFQSHI